VVLGLFFAPSKTRTLPPMQMGHPSPMSHVRACVGPRYNFTTPEKTHRDNFSRKATRFWARHHGVIIFIRSHSLLITITAFALPFFRARPGAAERADARPAACIMWLSAGGGVRPAASRAYWRLWGAGLIGAWASGGGGLGRAGRAGRAGI
jgi:hypothetical protein